MNIISGKVLINLANREVAVSMRDVTKTFGSVVANNKVSLDIYRGEILSLLGENGSGKTTLMNMLSGIYYPDEGEISIYGKPASIHSPREAFEYGIGMIHQHFKLVDVFTAAENIVLGLKEEGRLNLEQASVKIREICDKYGFEIDPQQKIYNMSVSQKQTVEIVKVLYRGADILILDEPTAVLTPQETEKLFAVLRNMKEAGKTVVIITHKLHEVLAISDRVAVLRKGEFIGDMVTAETNEQEMTNMMVGRQVSLNIDRPEPVNPKPRIRVEGLTVKSQDGLTKLDDVSFTANSGEILGIAGISGCGQKELLEAIAGLQPVESGTISYIDDDGGKDELIGKDPLQIAAMGVALSFVPEDRLGMGLVANMDLTDNMMLRSFRRGKSMFTDRKTPRKLAEKVVEELEVNTPSTSTPVRKLSGGNVQKVLVGREIASAPTVLLSAYIVRGLDINSSYTIYDLLNRQKQKGVAVIYVGEDLDVLMELSDRILVLCGGKVSGIVEGKTADKNQIGMMMTKLGGGKDNE
ncbi:MAG: ABC transporter ATP-binding protein [Clostridiales bacterium]|nr:ABC transporter ATP-binding protein [Clostridiales bacterium]MDD7035075.1 ABC transporter ATP-binding protein [Bacillota bacterium]